VKRFNNLEYLGKYKKMMCLQYTGNSSSDTGRYVTATKEQGQVSCVQLWIIQTLTKLQD